MFFIYFAASNQIASIQFVNKDLEMTHPKSHGIQEVHHYYSSHGHARSRKTKDRLHNMSAIQNPNSVRIYMCFQNIKVRIFKSLTDFFFKYQLFLFV